MLVKLNLKKNLLAGLLLSGSVAVSMAAASLNKNGTEYPLFPTLPRDQVVPHLSLGPNGGYLICQDSTIDGNGLGIRARRINGDLSSVASTFAVNSIIESDQQNARVAVLQNGGAVFVWQTSTGQGNKIYARFMDAEQRFLGPEFGIATRMTGHQSDPAVVTLNNGSVVVVWGEVNREDNFQDIWAQQFSATGERLASAFKVNTVTYLNQRTPAITALKNGGFVVAWVSDEFRARGSDYIDIAARLFDGNGNALGPDFALNSDPAICANPALTGTATGFRAAWSSRTMGRRVIVSESPISPDQKVRQENPASPFRWEVSTRTFDFQGEAAASEVVANDTRIGDQFSPRLLSLASGELLLWTTFGQDGSFEGIIARVARGAQEFDGDEFIVNTRKRLSQIFPTAAAIGDRILVAWASFISAADGFDIVAQQYQVSADEALPKPATPFAFAIGQSEITVSWSEVGGQQVAAYRIQIDNETTPVETASGNLRVSRPEWQPGSSHSIKLSYRLADGRVSPLSDAGVVTTWGADENGDSLPDDWQRDNWGKQTNWPLANADSDGDGASNIAEFLAGTDPTDSGSVLKVQISSRLQGLYLQWPTAAGSYYQLQYTTNFAEWTNVGASRFAASNSDAVPAPGTGQVQYYRVIRMR